MSKFRALVYNIEKLRKEIEDIQKSDDEIKKEQETKTVVAGILVPGIFNFVSKDISKEIYQDNNDEDEIKNIYSICKKKLCKIKQ